MSVSLFLLPLDAANTTAATAAAATAAAVAECCCTIAATTLGAQKWLMFCPCVLSRQ